MTTTPGAWQFSFGDVLLVPFPFTDQSDTKKRPAVVVSSGRYNAGRRDIVIMAITSQVRMPLGHGEAMVVDWQGAGLVKESVFKPIFSPPSNKDSSCVSWAASRRLTSRHCVNCSAL